MNRLRKEINSTPLKSERWKRLIAFISDRGFPPKHPTRTRFEDAVKECCGCDNYESHDNT